MPESLLSERLSVLATLDPDFNHTSLATDAWDMAKVDRVMAIIMVGAATTNATVDGVIQFSATSNGTFTSGVSGKSITQLTDADGDKQVIINLSAAEAASTTKRWANLKVTASTTGYSAAIVLGETKLREPWTTIAYGDLASVDEILK